MFQTGWGWVTYVKCQFYGHQIIRTSIFHNHGIEWRYSICRQPNAQNRENDPPVDISICCDVAKASFSCFSSLQPEQWKPVSTKSLRFHFGMGHLTFMQLLLMSIPLKKYIDIDQYSSHMFLSLLDLLPVNRISPAVWITFL